MRIGIDARAIGPHFPGVGRATLGLLHGLRQVEHGEQIVVFHRPGDLPLLEELGAAGDPRFACVAVDVGPFDLKQQCRLPADARAASVDIWHAPYYLRPFWSLPPTIVTIFDLIGPLGGSSRVGVPGRRSQPGAAGLSWPRLLWKLTMRLSVRSAAHIVTASHAARQGLRAAFDLPESKISVIPLAPDESFRPQSASAIESVRRTYALPERYVAYLGSNKPHKNLVALVEAWADLIGRPGDEASVENTRLVIAGHEDPRYPSARARTKELGLERWIHFLPDLPDDQLPPLLAGALLFVFPSLAEGFGLPPLEAMACGTPVLVSNRSSLPEVVGDAGLLVEPAPAALAMGMRRLLADDDLRHDLRERALRRAAEFSWQRTALSTLDLYRRVGAEGG